MTDGGFYHLEANTVAKTWAATKTTWGVIGSFAASNWGADIPMTYNAGETDGVRQSATAAGDQFKFKTNGGWTLSYGDETGKGNLTSGGANIGIPERTFRFRWCPYY
ncbi:MAG: hypothetical protein ABJB11_06425 [Ferruginibacter sp.]